MSIEATSKKTTHINQLLTLMASYNHYVMRPLKICITALILSLTLSLAAIFRSNFSDNTVDKLIIIIQDKIIDFSAHLELLKMQFWRNVSKIGQNDGWREKWWGFARHVLNLVGFSCLAHKFTWWKIAISKCNYLNCISGSNNNTGGLCDVTKSLSHRMHHWYYVKCV